MKKNIILFFAAAAMLASCNNAGEEKVDTTVVNNPNSASEVDTENLPAIEFEEVRYEFGEITQGEKVEHTYYFTNTGKSDLIVTSAKGSCGCTVPEWPKKPIKPGERGKIDVVFNSEGKKGQQHKKVTVVANTQPSTSEVVLVGKVIVPETEKTAETTEE